MLQGGIDSRGGAVYSKLAFAPGRIVLGKSPVGGKKSSFILDISELRNASGKSLAFHFEGSPSLLDRDVFSSPIALDGNVTCVGGEFWAEVEAATEADLECSRCAADFTMPLRVAFEEEVFPGEGDGVGPNAVDLEPLVRDNLVLSIPMQPVCREDCRGLCPRCGKPSGSCGCAPETDDCRWQVFLES